ncbi:MAG: hypothetical protein R3B54_02450 [Bdellovibrionota bacterium]
MYRSPILGLCALVFSASTFAVEPELFADSQPNRGNVVAVRRDVRPWHLDLLGPCKRDLSSWKQSKPQSHVFAYCRVSNVVPKNVEKAGLQFHQEGISLSETVNIGKYKIVVEARMESGTTLRLDGWLYNFEYSSYSGTDSEQASAKQYFASAVESAISKWKSKNTPLVHYSLSYSTRNDFQFDGTASGEGGEKRLYSTFDKEE